MFEKIVFSGSASFARPPSTLCVPSRRPSPTLSALHQASVCQHGGGTIASVFSPHTKLPPPLRGVPDWQRRPLANSPAAAAQDLSTTSLIGRPQHVQLPHNSGFSFFLLQYFADTPFLPPLRPRKVNLKAVKQTCPYFSQTSVFLITSTQF